MDDAVKCATPASYQRRHPEKTLWYRTVPAARRRSDGRRTQLVRKRETLEQLYAGETLLSA